MIRCDHGDARERGLLDRERRVLVPERRDHQDVDLGEDPRDVGGREAAEEARCADSCSARAGGPCIRRTPRARRGCGTPRRSVVAERVHRLDQDVDALVLGDRADVAEAERRPRTRGGMRLEPRRGPGRSARPRSSRPRSFRTRTKRSFRKWLGERKRSTPWIACRQACRRSAAASTYRSRDPAARGASATGGSPARTRRRICRTAGGTRLPGIVRRACAREHGPDPAGSARCSRRTCRGSRPGRSRRRRAGAVRPARRGSTSRAACRRPGSRDGARSR